MFVGIEIHLVPAKDNAFGRQAQTLLPRRFIRNFDRSARSHHPVPRQAVAMQIQHARYQAHMTWISGRRCNLSVTCHRAHREPEEFELRGLRVLFSFDGLPLSL